MGEAKRRKLANGGPVEDYRVPPGKFALTVDVAGCDPVTVVFEAAKLAELMRRARAIWPPSMSFPALVRGFAGEFAKGRNLDSIAIGIATTALYHPEHGARMCTAVSQALAHDGRAHVTWAFDPKQGLAIALADGFLDMAAPLAVAEAGVSVAIGRETLEPTAH